MARRKTRKRAWHETARDWAVDRLLRALLWAMMRLPYDARIRAMGWITRRILAPLAGYHRRSDENLRFVWPDMPVARRRQIALAVADNMGRTFAENYSGAAFRQRQAAAPVEGPGLAALRAADAAGRPVILATAHYGNYEAPRAALVAQGYTIGGLYRPARNRFFDRHYADTMRSWGGPVFAQGRSGTAGFVRHLKSGGKLVLLFDQFVARGALLPFLGKPAPTALSAAQLALRYDAELIPFYGIRNRDGLSFRIVLEQPVAHSDAETMTRALNESLEARIEEDPGQWLWVHRRWKPERVAARQRKRAAARMGPDAEA